VFVRPSFCPLPFCLTNCITLVKDLCVMYGSKFWLVDFQIPCVRVVGARSDAACSVKSADRVTHSERHQLSSHASQR